jgi:hypothetical protein
MHADESARPQEDRERADQYRVASSGVTPWTLLLLQGFLQPLPLLLQLVH